MKNICDHCEEPIRGQSYRVISHDDDGAVLLNMIVCEACHQRARNLGLRSEEMRPAVPRARRPVRLPRMAPRLTL